MTSQRSVSWASVVANGIVEELHSSISEGSAAATATAAAAVTPKASTIATPKTHPMATTEALPKTSPLRPLQVDICAKTSGGTSAGLSLIPSDSPLAPTSLTTIDRMMEAAPTSPSTASPPSSMTSQSSSSSSPSSSPSSSSSPSTANFCPSRFPFISHMRHPSRNVWPRQPTPYMDHHGCHCYVPNTDGSYRQRHHHPELCTGAAPMHTHYSGHWQSQGPQPMPPQGRFFSNHYPPVRMPTPLNAMQRPVTSLPPFAPMPPLGSTGQLGHFGQVAPPKPPRSSQSQTQNRSNCIIRNRGHSQGQSKKLEFDWEQMPSASAGLQDAAEDATLSKSKHFEPAMKEECQQGHEKLSPDQFNEMFWQLICQMHQVCDPLDGKQRHMEPSRPLPLPPPGFEHVMPVKRSISQRVLQLFWEQVKYGTPQDYPMLEPMIMQQFQHFIGALLVGLESPSALGQTSASHPANYDTHVTCQPAQLRIKNESFGDGSHVQPALKLVPRLAKVGKLPEVLPMPRYRTSLNANVAYWQSLQRGPEQEQGQDQLLERSIGEHLMSSCLVQNPNGDSLQYQSMNRKAAANPGAQDIGAIDDLNVLET